MSQARSLGSRALRRFLLTLALTALLLFLPARSLAFWQAWLMLGCLAVSWTFFLLHFLEHDPQLLERRLQIQEPRPEQKVFQKRFSRVLSLAFLAAGLDFHSGWSRALASIPLVLILSGQALVIAGYWTVFWVMKTNPFAASVIRIEAGQTVISQGPYALVRHPMYSGMALMALAMPFALGSYVALPLFWLLVPILGYRLVHEERFLRRDLPGYEQFCRQTRFRLLPGIW
jgi:protein-S-isoprenylcysteine O-methyltransferase Ste14